MNYDAWLYSIKDIPNELIKFNIEINDKTDLNENSDMEGLDNLYKYLLKSEKGKQYYIFKITPLITHWSITHNRIMRYS
tara:strand:+ start:2212 stop:2448 length:237 start_codon:yes stop_codon:yes gene_type:complete